MSDNQGNPLDSFSVQQGSVGRPIGAKLQAPLFIPYGQMLVMQDAAGLWWAVNIEPQGDGTARLTIQEVTL